MTTSSEEDRPDRLADSDVALLETLVLQAPVGFAFYGPDLRYRRINKMLAEINGLPMADHVGRRPAELLGDLGTAIEARLQRVLDTGEVVTDHDFTGVSPVTGELRHFDSRWFPAHTPDGTVIGVAVLVADVTEARRSEAALRHHVHRVTQLQRTTAGLGGALTVADVQAVVVSTVPVATGARTAYLELEGVGTPTSQPARPTGTREEKRVELGLSEGMIGTLVLGFDDAVPDGGDTLLAALVGQCAIAVERARLFERERSTALALQRSLLPDRLPDVPGVELAAWFRAGSVEADVGGDWYDVFALPDGRLALVVGDVMGKGVIAAAGMGRLRSALRALALVDPEPAAVLSGLDRVFSSTEEADQIATLVYLLVDPGNGSVLVSGAGHLPLALCREGVAPALFDAGAGSTPLGWPEVRTQRRVDLASGDVLVGFTDGLVERRGRDIDEGLDALLKALHGRDETLAACIDRVGRSLTPDTPGRDDATALAVRFT